MNVHLTPSTSQAMLLDKPIGSVKEIPHLLKKALKFGVERGLCSAGKEVVVLSSTFVASTGNIS